MKDYYPDFYQQTKEILVREIGEAKRWSAVEEAALALLHVKRMGKQMAEEAEHLDPNKSGVAMACDNQKITPCA